ncbi:hypothetical protein [uncultured Campylobacter sp.]|uniref:hypothetical protein n=1 Tax=uncultured Campylobacter sp. TaxID=218934 RepID=UPI0026353BED|nr:hypothetical protein [uncultured Campylobacter sp.]
MNKARLEELKKILNERHQNLEQGSQENSDAQNFDTSNSNASNSDNSNLNVEENLKFQNSDFDEAASNKNSRTGAKDYDKDPIVIKNYNIMHLLFYIIIAIIIPSIFIKILYNKGLIDLYYGGRTYLLYNQNSTFILSILFLCLFALYCYFVKENDIIINNSHITYFKNMSSGLEIFKINNDSFIKKNYKLKINVLCFILCLISLLSGFGYQEIIFVASILVVRFLPIFLFSILQNKKFEFYNPGYLYIKTRTGKQIIPLVSKKDTKEVREYFLNKLDIDISDKVNYFM